MNTQIEYINCSIPFNDERWAQTTAKHRYVFLFLFGSSFKRLIFHLVSSLILIRY